MLLLDARDWSALEQLFTDRVYSDRTSLIGGEPVTLSAAEFVDGWRMDAPCCDVFRLKDGKIQRFDCYPEGSVILSQLGVLPNLGAVLQPLPG